jgi:hypothetical protein
MKIAGYSETAWDWELLFLVVDSIALASMFYGLYAERAAFIQPFVVLSVSIKFEHINVKNKFLDNHDFVFNSSRYFDVLCCL